ncbi:hypothetical protein Dimus_025173 [Dionaea muscipula]
MHGEVQGKLMHGEVQGEVQGELMHREVQGELMHGEVQDGRGWRMEDAEAVEDAECKLKPINANSPIAACAMASQRGKKTAVEGTGLL